MVGEKRNVSFMDVAECVFFVVLIEIRRVIVTKPFLFLASHKVDRKANKYLVYILPCRDVFARERFPVRDIYQGV